MAQAIADRLVAIAQANDGKKVNDIIFPLPADLLYTTWLAATGMAHSMETYLIFVMEAERHFILTNARPAILVDNANAQVQVPAAPAVIGAGVQWNVDVSFDEAQFVHVNIAQIRRDAAMLLIAANAGELTFENVTAYYASVNTRVATPNITRWANANAATMANPRIGANFAALCQGNAWLTYRVTVASGIGLVARASVAVPPIFTNDEITHANNYVATPWDNARANNVTQRSIAKAYAVAEAYGFLPGRWYMGRKAVDAIDPTSVAKWRKFAKVFKEKSLEFLEEAANAAEDLAGLTAAGNALR
jgi:hypothetical protein